MEISRILLVSILTTILTHVSLAIQCLQEKADVDKFHVYKAHAASKFTTGHVTKEWPMGKDHPSFLAVRKRTNDGRATTFYIDESASDCILPKEGEYIFYLHPTNRTITLPGKSLSSKGKIHTVWAAAAEPTKYSKKAAKQIKKFLDDSKYCKKCPREPYIKSAHKFEETRRSRLNAWLQVECKVRGFPQPHMYWHFNGRPVNDSSIIITSTWKKNVLEIPFVMERHRGNYTCIGTNFQNQSARTGFTLELADDNIVGCPKERHGFCMNGGQCFHLVKQDAIGCYCVGSYVGRRCEWYGPSYAQHGLGSNGKMVPVGDVVLICAGIVAFAVFLVLSHCLCVAFQNKRRRRMQLKLNQSYDYSNSLVPAPFRKPCYSFVGDEGHIKLTNSFIQGTRDPRNGTTASVNKTQNPDSIKTVTPSATLEQARLSFSINAPSTSSQNRNSLQIPLPPRKELTENRKRSPARSPSKLSQAEPVTHHTTTDPRKNSEERSRSSDEAGGQRKEHNSKVVNCKETPTKRKNKDLSDDDSPSPMSNSDFSMARFL